MSTDTPTPRAWLRNAQILSFKDDRWVLWKSLEWVAGFGGVPGAALHRCIQDGKWFFKNITGIKSWTHDDREWMCWISRLLYNSRQLVICACLSLWQHFSQAAQGADQEADVVLLNEKKDIQGEVDKEESVTTRGIKWLEDEELTQEAPLAKWPKPSEDHMVLLHPTHLLGATALDGGETTVRGGKAVVRDGSMMLEHTTTRLYIKHCRLISEQGEEGTVYIDKDITLVGGDSKRIRLSYLMTD